MGSSGEALGPSFTNSLLRRASDVLATRSRSSDLYLHQSFHICNSIVTDLLSRQSPRFGVCGVRAKVFSLRNVISQGIRGLSLFNGLSTHSSSANEL